MNYNLQEYIQNRRDRVNKFLYMDFYSCNYTDINKVTLTNKDFILQDGQSYNVIQSFTANYIGATRGVQTHTISVSLQVFSKEHLQLLYNNMIRQGCRTIIHIYTDQLLKQNIYDPNTKEIKRINKTQDTINPSQLIVDFTVYDFNISNSYDQVFSITISGYMSNKIFQQQKNLIQKIKQFNDTYKSNLELIKNKKVLKYLSLKEIFNFFDISFKDNINQEYNVIYKYLNNNNYNIDIPKRNIVDKISFSILHLKNLFSNYNNYISKQNVIDIIYKEVINNFKFTTNDNRPKHLIYNYKNNLLVLSWTSDNTETITFTKNKQISDILQMSFGVNVEQQHLITNRLISKEQSDKIYKTYNQDKLKINDTNQEAIQIYNKRTATPLQTFIQFATQELSITLEGITGFKINDTFKFKEGDFFIQDLMFYITQIQHTVNPGKWLTKIDSIGFKLNES